MKTTDMLPYFMLLLMLSVLELSLSLQIPCQVQLEPGVQYRKIFWYKVTGSDSLRGLVMKDLSSNTTVLYKFANHSYEIGEDMSLLLLPEFIENNCETYRCSVWPPVGYGFQESDYSLPQGCQTSSNMMPEFVSQAMDKKMGLESSVYGLAGVLVLLGGLSGVLLVLCGITLLYSQKEKYTKVPV